MPAQPYALVFEITALLSVLLALHSWRQRHVLSDTSEQRLPQQLLDRRRTALALVLIGVLSLLAIVMGGEPAWFSAYLPPALMLVLEILVPTAAAVLGLLLLWQLSDRLAAALARMAAANTALRESEIRYRTISDLTTDTIYSLRIDGDGQFELEWVSESFSSTTGYSQDELRHQDGWLKILHPDDVDIDRQHDATLRSGRSDVCEYRVFTKQGQVRWLRDYARPIWDADHRRIVQILGAAQDITASKHAQATHRFLAEASGLLASSLDYETTLVHVARLTIPQLADWCMIHLVDDDYTLRRVALTFADPAKQQLAEELQQHYPLASNAPHSFPHVIRTGHPELIPEVTDAGLQRIARDARHLEILRALGFCSTLSVPLIARDRTIGSIMLGTAESNRRYDEYDLRIAEELAGRVALAVDNARLFAERTTSANRLRRRNDELQALHEMMLGLINRLDTDSLLGALVNRAGALLDTAHGYLYVFDPSADDLVVRVANGIFAKNVGYRIGRGEGLAGQVWDTGKAQSIDNYRAWPRRRNDLDQMNLRAIASVPMRAGSDLIGVLGLAYIEDARTFGPAEIALLERFADLASLALENARLYSAAQQELAERRRTEAALLSAEAELRAAKEQAEAASQAKTEFLAQMSHDMRTPISSALGITELLGQTNLDTNQRELVELIRASGDALLALLNNFLDLAKIEAGRLTLERHPFVLDACIEKAIDVIASKVAAKGLDLAYTLDPHLPAIFFGDQHRLGQILLNLLGNAAKFTQSGGILISVTAQPISEATYELHFSVADTGIGIPPAQHEQVFKAFQQLHGPAAHESPGIGLGLAIAKQLSELMGGRMWLESTVGVGSTFHFTIVAEAPPAQADDRPAAIANLAGKHMLIIDPHVQSQQALGAYARAQNLLVSIAGSVQQVLAASAPAQPFDVVAADIREGQDPATLAAQLREHFGTPELPLILLTPLGPQDPSALVDQHSMMLRKPIKLSQLQRLLQSLFGQHPRRAIEATHARQPAASTPLASQPRILLAEDDRANQQLGLRILQKLGLPHTAVATGAQALAALDEGHYDIVLLDIQMPGMSGLEAAQLIRQRYPRDRQPYLIAITATTSADVRAECLKAGVNDYLIKPLEIAQLQAALGLYTARAAMHTAQHGQLLQHELGTPASASATAAAALDPDALERIRSLFGPQQEKLRTLFASYGEDSAALVAQMYAADAAGDQRLLQQSVHQLKSSSTLVAALALANLCTEFEGALLTAGPADRRAWIERIAAEVREVKRALAHEAQR